MKSYDCLCMRASKSGISVISTEPETMDRITSDIKRLIPSCRVEITRRLPNDEPYTLDLTYLRNQDVDVSFWILKQLCKNGWKPVTVDYRFDFFSCVLIYESP